MRNVCLLFISLFSFSAFSDKTSDKAPEKKPGWLDPEDRWWRYGVDPNLKQP